MMDGDGEHPPSLVPEMVRLFEMGYDIVQTQRIDTDRKGFAFKRVTGSLFYSLINRLGRNPHRKRRRRFQADVEGSRRGTAAAA